MVCITTVLPCSENHWIAFGPVVERNLLLIEICPFNWSFTDCFNNSSFHIRFALRKSFGSEKIRKFQGAKSGLYGGRLTISHLNMSSNAFVLVLVWFYLGVRSERERRHKQHFICYTFVTHLTDCGVLLQADAHSGCSYFHCISRDDFVGKTRIRWG